MKNGKIRKLISKFKKMINYLLLKSGLKDLYFYYHILKFIKNNKNSAEWKKFGLRDDWVGRIYTVASIDKADESLPTEVKEVIMFDKIRDLILWLDNQVLGEILYPRIESIPNTLSYLIIFSPRFHEIGFKWLIKSILFITAIYFSYPYIQKIIEHVSK